MRMFCEHCYTDYTEQTHCPYCAARPALRAHLARGPEHLRQQKEKLETLRQEAAKGRSFAFLLWIIPTVLWMWLLSKAEVHPEEGMSAEAVALLMTVITYVVPSILCAGLMVLGFFLSGWKVKRRKKKLAEFEPELVEFFRVQEQNYPAYQQELQQRYQENLRIQREAGIFVEEEQTTVPAEELHEISDEQWEKWQNEIFPQEELVGNTGIFTRAKTRKEYEMDKKYKERMEDLFIDGF